MKKYILLIILSLILVKSAAQEVIISDSATISLITCSPGEEVYAKFGHTAIRVKDSAKELDIVFNYGLFDFESEHFYYKFIKGETDYQLGINQTSIFLPEYAKRNSIVWEQVLNLTVAEKSRLINLLLENLKEENRIYRYNFIFDNCSIRPRDKIIGSINGFIKFAPSTEQNTFREWVGVYVGNDTWLKFGIDLIFGVDADNIATQNESMFLPEVLMKNMQAAQITSFNREKRNLVEKKATVLVSKSEKSEPMSISLFKPLNIAILLLIIGTLVTIWDVKNKEHNKTFDTIILVINGLGGLVVFYMMFFSLHPLVRYNLNILWLSPINLLMAVAIWKNKIRKPLFLFQIPNILLLVGALITFPLSIQDFNVATFPLIVLFLMRASHWFAR
ncbi:MAG: DUF4105 domain-containing protein, partial [Paludibacter sp.]